MNKPSTSHSVAMIQVFVRDGAGGNPVPLVVDAREMSAADMQAVAMTHGHESAFVLPAERQDCDWRFRFFVPAHEMEMCGHATLGTLWALRQWGHWKTPTTRIETLSGVVDARWDDTAHCAWVSQPPVTSRELDDAARNLVADVLGLQGDAAQLAMHNASTSRVKTLLALPTVTMLNSLNPDFSRMEQVCTAIGSTGLYPYAPGATNDDGVPIYHARQFPRSSGYPEDAATGIAAAALWGFLDSDGQLKMPEHPIAVWQGDAMGSPSEIRVTARVDNTGSPSGCWLSGQVAWAEHA